ncbi:MAG: CheY-like chemotaxis protein [Candidatus Azotimanducaceae bacterium]|jgi:CheY-like chemotaxis protein
MQNSSDQNGEMIETMPLGVVELDSYGLVRKINFYANNLGIQLEQEFASIIHTDSQSEFEKLAKESDSEVQVQILTHTGTFHVRIRLFSESIYFIWDLSEQYAISVQLQKSKEPEKKFLHDISNAFTTTMGYSELTTMMLEEHDTLTGERLASLKRYQSEVLIGLKRVDTLIKEQRKRKVNPDVIPINRRHVMIIDDEPSIAEFLSELMRAKHYKVTAFTSSLAALQFYKESTDSVDLVIMDQIMPEMNGINLATEFLALNIDLPIVLCTGDHSLISDQSTGKIKIEHFISKPIDISELTQMVAAIID